VAEASDFIAKNPEDPLRFDMGMLRANALLAQKKPDEAISSYKFVAEKFASHPELYQVKLNMALAYEYKKEWDQALKLLQEMRDAYPYPDIIDMKIRAITKRKERKRDL
jgi:tetratricopeptide (TPR) repeat protein